MTTYVTHEKCGGIVSIAELEGDVALYVYCDACNDLVEASELPGEFYLVGVPREVPELSLPDPPGQGDQEALRVAEDLSDDQRPEEVSDKPDRSNEGH